mmetsp:Transcript_6271/g.7947  ORF Transcript_6271/g.7947 Transcript_6271/m.7947 type:complete len:120 (+) Transcript_6271:110-469(+)
MFSAAARIALRRTPATFNTVLRTPCNQTFQRAFASTFVDPKEVTERILSVIKNFDKVDPSKVAISAKFNDDLGLDSLDTVEVVMAIEDEFAIEIPDAEADKILSVEDAVEYISGHPMAK